MKPKNKLVLLVFLVIFASIDCKRSGGRGRGKGKSGTSFWNRRNNQSGSNQGASYPKQEYAPKPASAPKPVQESVVKQTNVGQQQSAQQRPIGWNPPQNPPPYSSINSKNSYPQNPPPYSGINTKNSYPQQAPPPYSRNAYPQQAPPPYSSVDHNRNVYSQQSHYPGAYPNTGSNNYYGTGSSYNYGSAGYPQQSYNPPGYHQPPMGGYNSGPGGYGNAPMMANNQYQQQGGGMFGGMFGGNNHHGGYGGYGGMGGYGGYGMKKSGGFFGQHAFRNILAGMVIWHVVSGLTRRPYHVYNYYNQPEEKEISLPSNILTLCNENATNLCAPGTTAICTTNNTIMCVTTVSALTPCPEQKAMCVNSTIECLDNDPLCQNNTKGQNFTTVPLPCFANLTVDVNLMNFDPNTNGTNGNGQNYTYCVTTYAVPGPESDPCLPSNTNGTNSQNIPPGCGNGTNINPTPNLENVTLNTTIVSTTQSTSSTS